VSDSLLLASPALIGLLVNFISKSQTSQSLPEWQGYAFAVSFLLFQILSTLANNSTFYRTNMIAYKARMLLITSVYRKSLLLSGAAQQVRPICSLKLYLTLGFTFRD
jgi:hypothetical protein